MQIIYRAFDGKEFDNEADCCYYESEIENSVIMLNRNNERVYNTSSAFLVWLRNEEANLAFHAMARKEGDKDVKSITEGEDWGLYYWDEGYNEYRWLDRDMIDGLIKMKQMVEESGGRF